MPVPSPSLKVGASVAPTGRDAARWERLLMRRPALALPVLQRVVAQGGDEPPSQALLGLFFILERCGRGPELQGALEAALASALDRAQHRADVAAREQAAELSEALGRLHYQRGDYLQACNAWSQTLELTRDDTRWACLARIGLAHLCFAVGDWARGGRVLDQAERHYPGLGGDAYLRAKIGLNRAAASRATVGPEAAIPLLDQAQRAARQAGHRDYEAETLWHRARGARDSGDAGQAAMLARRSLQLARRCDYRWLQAQCLLLLSELQDEEALVHAQEALTLGEALQSRAVQAAAHARLSQLMADRGALGPSWHHQQQRQRLEAVLGQSALPARLEQLARFDQPLPSGHLQSDLGPLAQEASALSEALTALAARAQSGATPEAIRRDLQRLSAVAEALAQTARAAQATQAAATAQSGSSSASSASSGTVQTAPPMQSSPAAPATPGVSAASMGRRSATR